jgi:16S rRNA (guanine(966)-N(2))-methyltransferase RsmD
MRIISGKYKGRKLFSNNEDDLTRPTLDRVKEAVFSAIQFDIEGNYFLDLFSGTGSIGLEAISRSAAYTVFIDNNENSIKTIEKNISLVRPERDKYFVINSDYKTALKKITKYRFQIVYCDPPYKEKEIYSSLLDDVYNIVKEKGLVIIEHNEIMDFNHKDYELISFKKYGTVYISILRKLNLIKG